MAAVELVIVHTCGFEPGTKAPDVSGLSRIHRAASILKANENDSVVDDPGYKKKYVAFVGSIAKSYESFFRKRYPEYAHLIAFSDCHCKITNRDLEAADSRIWQFFLDHGSPSIHHARLFDLIGMISHPDHINDIIKPVLKSLGYCNLIPYPTNEKRPYSAIVQILLKWITKVDPRYKWLGLPLVWMTRNRATDKVQF